MRHNFVLRFLREFSIIVRCQMNCALITAVGVTAVSLASIPCHAQSATGTATITYSLTSTDWAVQSQTETDNGGNYTSGGPGYITATVHAGDAVTSRGGTILTVTTFEYTGSGSPTAVTYVTYLSATAIINMTGQSSYGAAKGHPFGALDITLGSAVTWNGFVGLLATDSDTATCTVTTPGTTTTNTAETQAEATTPVGGC